MVTQAGKHYHLKTGNTQFFQSDKQIVIESGQELTIRSSGGFIKIDDAGITIQGKVVNINTGGSPGVGMPVQANVAKAAMLATGGSPSDAAAPEEANLPAEVSIRSPLPAFTPRPAKNNLLDSVKQASAAGDASILLR